jgi:hypothetical protein
MLSKDIYLIPFIKINKAVVGIDITFYSYLCLCYIPFCYFDNFLYIYSYFISLFLVQVVRSSIYIYNRYILIEGYPW